MKQKIVAGNWKMNNDVKASENLVQELLDSAIPNDVRVMIAPATVFLDRLAQKTKGTVLEVVSQNMHAAPAGAYTGEIAANMLQSIGVKTTLLGHSERRAYYNETDAGLAKKTAAVNQSGMEMIFCFGEELEDRKQGKHFEVVKEQLTVALFRVPELDWSKIILAYEPVWAIGTGETASPEQAQEMHAFVRSLLAQQLGQTVAAATSILYGGSVKPTNAKELFTQDDVDGGLIGGASLHAEDFMAIVKALS
ncbi:MAG: triose-phosphate isomerase [Flavobacteriaceae bacterium]